MDNQNENPDATEEPQDQAPGEEAPAEEAPVDPPGSPNRVRYEVKVPPSGDEALVFQGLGKKVPKAVKRTVVRALTGDEQNGLTRLPKGATLVCAGEQAGS